MDDPEHLIPNAAIGKCPRGADTGDGAGTDMAGEEEAHDEPNDRMVVHVAPTDSTGKVGAGLILPVALPSVRASLTPPYNDVRAFQDGRYVLSEEERLQRRVLRGELDGTAITVSYFMLVGRSVTVAQLLLQFSQLSGKCVTDLRSQL